MSENLGERDLKSLGFPRRKSAVTITQTRIHLGASRILHTDVVLMVGPISLFAVNLFAPSISTGNSEKF